MQVLTVSDFFSRFDRRKVVKKWVSSTFVDFSKNFFSGCTSSKIEQGFLILTGLLGEEVASFLGYAWLWMVGVDKVL